MDDYPPSKKKETKGMHIWQGFGNSYNIINLKVIRYGFLIRLPSGEIKTKPLM